jgi:gamma-glutamylcyclotransferase (GGCT)/AIG2-like uncharacterized protein YtfP
MPFLFSYGSNNKDQLEERLNIKITKIEPAYYENHALAFGSWSKNWNGAVGTLMPVKNEKVYGYLTHLENSDLDRLDKFEAVHLGKYQRTKIRVTVKETGKFRMAIAYILTPKHKIWKGVPSKTYIDAISKTQSYYWAPLKIEIQIRNVETGQINFYYKE